ncbi:MAG TPA: flavin reductase family protein [Lutibacter sp.]|nr:flavin reductase family protein [Lutibacter sp.]
MTKSIDPKDLPQAQLHSYLLSAVAPRPIALASTVDENGAINLSPFSFFNVFSSNPPILIFSPARRGRDNTTKHTYENILKVKEVVINIVNYSIVEQMSLSSTEYEQGVNEFNKAGFTPIKSTKIQPPRVGEAPVAFECVVDDIIALGKGPGAGNLIIARVVQVHIQEKYLDKEGNLDTIKLDLVARMGGNWYTRAIKESLFEIPKPIRTKGIGVDKLPKNIRESSILTGNNLGRLGNIENLPQTADILKIKERPEIQKLLIQFKNKPKKLEIALHTLAKEYLEKGDTEKAIGVLCLFE